jgi:hypothetical protein
MIFETNESISVTLLFLQTTISTVAPVAQLDRAPACGAGGRRFESCRAHHTVEQIACFLFDLCGVLYIACIQLISLLPLIFYERITSSRSSR